MRRSGRLGASAAAASVLLLATACSHIPADASVKDFCSRGEVFSASTTFTAGVKAARRLGETGTPPGIPDAARQGFVELIDRVTGSKSGADFKQKADNLSPAERVHLEALSNYIARTCHLDG
jgi:hypothetical protein